MGFLSKLLATSERRAQQEHTPTSTVDRDFTVDLHEFDKLRDEIISRQHAMMTLRGIELAALAAALSLATTLPEALLGVAAVSLLLWSSYISQRHRVATLGMYIGSRLRPRVARHDDQFAWEEFIRDNQPETHDRWNHIIFWLPSVLLAVFYWVVIETQCDSRSSWVVGASGEGIIAVLLALVFKQYRAFRVHALRAREAVKMRGPTSPSGAGIG